MSCSNTPRNSTVQIKGAILGDIQKAHQSVLLQHTAFYRVYGYNFVIAL